MKTNNYVRFDIGTHRIVATNENGIIRIGIDGDDQNIEITLNDAVLHELNRVQCADCGLLVNLNDGAHIITDDGLICGDCE